MTIQKLLQRMQDVVNMDDFKEVLTIVEGMAGDEMAKETKQGSQLSASKKVLKSGMSKSRPILQKAVIRDDFQVFTNGHVGFMLNNHIAGLPLHDPEKVNFASYPNIEKLIMDQNASTVSRVFNVGDLKKQIGSLGKTFHIELELNSEESVRFEKSNLENLIKVLNYKNNDNIQLKYRPSTHVHDDIEYLNCNFICENENGYAVIVPLNVPKEKRQ